MYKPKDGEAFYWTTGVVAEHQGGGWYRAYLDFDDGGHCDNDSTKGTLCLKYQEDSAQKMIERIPVLVNDALTLGVHLGVGPVGVALYLQGEDVLSQDAELFQTLADERGWQFCDESGEGTP
jgi:hypothetical protein